MENIKCIGMGIAVCVGLGSSNAYARLTTTVTSMAPQVSRNTAAVAAATPAATDPANNNANAAINPTDPAAAAKTIPLQLKPNPNAPNQANPNNNAANQQMLQNMMNNNNGQNSSPNLSIPDIGKLIPSAPPKADTDWANYQYPSDYVFQYGGRGAGNIGNGLCLEKNKDKTQVKNGYCQILSETLRDPTSCAGRAMASILSKARSGDRVEHLGEYCSTFNRMGSNQSEVFLQFLAALITAESGWHPQAVEGGWYKGGKLMQGKGLFQIGVDDSSKDPDCAALNQSSIFDPKTNIRCGACIAMKNIDRDNNMGEGVGDSGTVGAARYFGPLRNGQAEKRSAMMSSVNNYCVASTTGNSASGQVALSSGGANSSR